MTTSTSTPRRSSSGSTLGAVADQPDRHRLARRLRCKAPLRPPSSSEGGQLVEVPRLHPPPQPPLRDVHDQAHPAVQRDRQRLRAAHAAAAAGDRQRAPQGPVPGPPMRPRRLPGGELVGDGRERLVGALQDPLGADVDPRPGGHLPVHRQPEPLQPAELRPGRPVADEVRVGDQHPRRPLVRPQHPDGPAGLDEQRLVALQRRQRADQRVERGPVPRRTPRPAVDDEVVGPLGDVRVQVVLEHPQRGLGLPRACGQRGAPRGAHGARAYRSCQVRRLCRQAPVRRQGFT